MIDIRKLVTIRDVAYSELGHKAAKPIVRGTEILTVKDGLFNEWIASFSVWRHGDLVKIPGAKHQGGEA